jgi:hypothetical protein
MLRQGEGQGLYWFSTVCVLVLSADKVPGLKEVAVAGAEAT